MNTSTDKLFIQKIAQICQLLDDLSMDGLHITGIAKNTVDLQVISSLLKDAGDVDSYFDYEINILNVKFYKVASIFKNFEKLLSDSGYRRNTPSDSFYLVDDKQAYYSDEDNSFFINYLNIIKLYRFLEKKADHKSNDGGVQNLIFLGSKKLILSDEYDYTNLVELKDLDNFISKFSHDDSIQGVSHKEKDQILKKTLVKFFKDCDSIKLSQVIQDFSKINNYVSDELDIYMSKFSYDDVRKEVEKDKTDFIVRLNKVFSDIQTQLIGVPVSVILAADKLKIGSDATQGSNQFLGMHLTNCLVILAIGFYAIVLTMLIRNQTNTLDALKDEIDHHESLFKSKHKAIAERFQNSFNQIKNRYDHQKKMLLWVDILVSCAFGVIFIIAYTSSFSSNLNILLPFMGFSLLIGLVYFYNEYE